MSQPTALLPGERRILRLDEVEAKSGFKRAHIYSLMKKGEFPQSLRLGVRAVGWDSTEIDLWITERLKNRAQQPALPNAPGALDQGWVPGGSAQRLVPSR